MLIDKDNDRKERGFVCLMKMKFSFGVRVFSRETDTLIF